MIINTATLIALRTNLKTSFQNAFKGVEPLYKLVAMTTTSTTSRETYGWMGGLPQIREWIGDRQVKNLEAFDYTLKNRKFELTIGVKRDDIADNTLAGYGITAADFGQKAGLFPDRLIWDVVKNGHQNACYDGQYFFDTDHPVAGASVSNSLAGAGAPWFLLDLSGVVKPFLFQEREAFDFVALDRVDDPNVFLKEEFIYGTRGRMNAGYGLWQLAMRSQATLDSAGYDAARIAMQAFKDNEGELLGVKPTHLVVPPALETAAKQLIDSPFLAPGVANPHYNTVKVVVAPLLG